MSSSLDRIIGSAPVNRTAAKVVSGKGETWEPNVAEVGWQDHPRPVVPLPPNVDHNPAWRNLTGQRIGRVRVLGYAGRNQATTSSRWSVRCDCGKYGCFSSKFLRSEAAQSRAMCPWCDRLVQMQRGEHRSPQEKQQLRAEKAARKAAAAPAETAMGVALRKALGTPTQTV